MFASTPAQTNSRKTGARTSIQVANVMAVMHLVVAIGAASMPLAAATATDQEEATHLVVCIQSMMPSI